MLSYLHGFHAGNFADVHKHWLLSLLLQNFQRKESAFTYLETHAGNGRYDLTSEAAQKNCEYAEGIGRLWQTQELPPSCADYVALCRELNPSGQLEHYPGSPLIARHWLRPQDRAIVMEAHPAVYEELQHCFARDKQVAVHKRNGYEGLKAFVPVKTPRLLVLIDPSYEQKSEYRTVAQELAKAWQRARHGIFVVWYPLLQAERHKPMLDAIQQANIAPVLRSEIIIGSPALQGMHGSGMLIVNPPWQLDETVQQDGPQLVRLLAGDYGRACCEWLATERKA